MDVLGGVPLPLEAIYFAQQRIIILQTNVRGHVLLVQPTRFSRIAGIQVVVVIGLLVSK